MGGRTEHVELEAGAATTPGELDQHDDRFVVWLLPEERTERLIQSEIIDVFAAATGMPRFQPHVTVCGGTRGLRESDAIERVAQVVQTFKTWRSNSSDTNAVEGPVGDEDRGSGGSTSSAPILIPFTAVRSERNFWAQDLYLEVARSPELVFLCKELQRSLLGGGLVQQERQPSNHTDEELLLFAPPCRVPHMSLLYQKDGHDPSVDTAAEQRYANMRKAVEIMLDSNPKLRGETTADRIALMQIGGRGISPKCGWESIPYWRLVQSWHLGQVEVARQGQAETPASAAART
ncbi:unnamed protein product [Amoebophrya sp. A120]|nr:unnamed protein product [Amoebophrya sp. A120]|eukprot:GSA120T00011218001.1